MEEHGWRVELLGPVRIVAGVRVVDTFRTRRVPLLLAYLLLKPDRTAHREELGEMLWPGSDTQTQRKRLRFEITHLRHCLSTTAILTHGHQTVALAPDVTCDVAEWESANLLVVHADNPEKRIPLLRAALALYRDDLMPGLYLPDGCPPEKDWLALRRESLRESRYELYCRLNLDLKTLGLTNAALTVNRECAMHFPERMRETNAVAQSFATPPPINGFVGRQVELRRIHSWMRGAEEPAVLTIIGTGGIGKTRLVQEAIATQNAIFVSFADTDTARSFYDVIHGALNLPELDEIPIAEQVMAALRARGSLLLVLDNLEQIASGVARRLPDLLAACPRLRCLCTSRRSLQIQEERTLFLDTLPPDEALTLFFQRARALRLDFANLPIAQEAAQDVVRLLDGVPLAIELAAGHATILGPRQMYEQIARRLTFLTASRPAEDPRHRSIRATLDWSLGLLPSKMRDAFARFSVFRGGFSFAAAKALYREAADEPQAESDELLVLLAGLERHSLLKTAFTNDEPHYAMLSLTQAYAEELLTPEQRQALRQRHADFFRGSAAEVEQNLTMGRWEDVRRQLQVDRENLRAAWRFCVESGQHPATFDFMRYLATALFELGFWQDADDLLECAGDSRDGGTPQQIKLLSLRGALHRRRGNEDAAREDWLHLLDLARPVDPWRATGTLFDLAGQALDQGQWHKAEAYLREGIVLTEQYGYAVRRVTAMTLQSRLSMECKADGTALHQAEEAWAGLLRLGTEASIALTAFVTVHLSAVNRRYKEWVRAEEIVLYGLRRVLEQEQTFLVARHLDELAPTLAARQQQRDALTAYVIAAAIHTELHTRHRRRSIAVLTEYREASRHHKSDDASEYLADYLVRQPWRDLLESLAHRLLSVP